MARARALRQGIWGTKYSEAQAVGQGLNTRTGDRGQDPEPRKEEWAGDREASRDVGTRQSLHDRTERKCLACSKAQGPRLGHRKSLGGPITTEQCLNAGDRPLSSYRPLSWSRVQSRAESVRGERASSGAERELQDQDRWGE